MGSRCLVAGLLLLAASEKSLAADPVVSVSTVSAEIPFDPKDYPELGVDEVARSLPCTKGRVTVEIKDALFRQEFVFQGAVRKASKGHFELMRQWTKAVGDPGAASKYRQEISVADGRNIRWLSAPEALIDLMPMDFRAGDRILLYLVYAGCEGGLPLFAVDDYSDVRQTDEEAGDTII